MKFCLLLIVFHYISVNCLYTKTIEIKSADDNPYQIDWSMVKPLHSMPEFQKRYENHFANILENSLVMAADNITLENDTIASVKIVGGHESNPNSFSYQVGIAMIMPESMAWCGGSIINSKYILTAAHCLDAPGMNTVVLLLGAHNLQASYEPGRQEIISRKSSWIIHQQWNEKVLRNDIALISLTTPVEFNEYIQPIRLPSYSEMNTNIENIMVTVSGWGHYSDSIKDLSTVLRYVNVPILSQSKCGKYFPDVIVDTHLCTNGIQGRSTCNGDSGGPLVLTETDGKRTIIGIVSFGLSVGCERNWPGVFTRVTSYLPWLSQYVNIQ